MNSNLENIMELEQKYRRLLRYLRKQEEADENEKIDLSIYMAKLKGLRQVVLQTSEKNSSNVERLKDIYNDLSIRVSVTHNFIDSQKKLGLFW